MHQTTSPDISGFAKTHKTAYSHGLEQIYSLETVDLKTVRPLAQPKAKKNAKKKRIAPQAELELDFGAPFRKTRASFVLDEPTALLGIVKHSQKKLEERNIATIRDLLKTDLDALAYEKGFGQGHVEEIGGKLRERLKGVALQSCESIDFAAWIRSLVGKGDLKRAFVYLKEYSLEELIPLSAMEMMQVRRLTLEMRREWMEEVLFDEKGAKDSVEEVVAAYLLPWMRQRHGIATKWELSERLQRISEDEEIAKKSIKFLNEVFCEGEFAFGEALFEVERDLFCADRVVSVRFEELIAKAKTYFYKPGISYKLEELTLLLLREFAIAWKGFDPHFIKRALRLSSSFRVRKGEDGHLVVRMSAIHCFSSHFAKGVSPSAR